MKKFEKDIKIVIIEDDQEKREELIEIIRDLGFSLNNISQSKYAKTGIELINDELPDVVLLDLKIPYSEDDEKIKTDNSNIVIREVERLNGARNQEDSSTGILIISASVKDDGMRKAYKQFTEVVDFFDKDEIALNEKKFKSDLLKKIHTVVERNFKHETKIEYNDIRNVKLNKLKAINEGLFNRIQNDLLGQFEKLNNRSANTYKLAENIVALSGRIVEDIVNLVENKEINLSPIYEEDNFNSIRNKLIKYTGREWDYSTKSHLLINEQPIFSRQTAEYARFAYQLRSDVLHSKEGDAKNNKLFIKNPTIQDAAISINLIIPLIQEYINYCEKNI